MSILRRSAALASIAILTLGLQACDLDVPGGSSGAGGKSEGSGGSGGSGEGDGGESGNDEEPTGEDMEADFELFVEWVTQYSEQKDLPLPAEWNFLPDGEEMETECTDADGNEATADDTAYFYCGADEEVYVGEATMQLFADEFGHIAPGVGIAHEWGHHVQRSADVPVSTQEEYIALENQADCVAGAWYGDLSKERGFKLQEAGEIAEMMVKISELEGEDRTHGTVVERTTSVATGAFTGLKQCEAMIPDSPILG